MQPASLEQLTQKETGAMKSGQEKLISPLVLSLLHHYGKNALGTDKCYVQVGY